MKAFLEQIVAWVVSTGIYFLHNRHTPNFSREEIRYLRLSFSQFGEDIAVARWFDEKFNLQKGVYVDVGAFHPIHCSNTLLLSKKGWCGVNIDMNSDKISLFKDLRSRDVNIYAAVSDTSGRARSLRSGLVEEMMLDPCGEIPVRRLDDILSHTSFQKIDYLNIDCEGQDYEVLQSIDLDLYQPKVITIEALSKEAVSRVGNYLTSKGYGLEEKLHYTLLFVRRSAQPCAGEPIVEDF